MIEALQNGQIAGAGLDVFETEPLPAGSPLRLLPNVVIAAARRRHYARSDGSRARDGDPPNALAFRAGAPINLVNGPP